MTKIQYIDGKYYVEIPKEPIKEIIEIYRDISDEGKPTKKMLLFKGKN